MNIKYYNNQVDPIQFVYLTDADGTTKLFTLNSEITPTNTDARYNSPPGVYQKLYRKTGVFILEEKSGVKYYFRDDGYIDKIEDNNNNITSMTYLAGQISKIKDPSNREVNFNYVNGKLDTITGSPITTVKYEYAGNYLQKVKKLDSTGVVLTEVIYGYDTFNNIKTVTDAEGKTVEYLYAFNSDFGLHLSTVKRAFINNDNPLPIELVTSYNYIKANEVVTTTITHPEGNRTIYNINSNGNVTDITAADKVGGSTDQYKISYTWDEINQLNEVKLPKGSITAFEYDAQGNPTRVIDPQGHIVINRYTANNDTEEIVNALGTPTTNTYSETRNLKISSTSINSTMALDYDNNGNVLWQTDPIGIAANLAQNSGFEKVSGSLPEKWIAASKPRVTVAIDNATKVNGYNSVKLTVAAGTVIQQATLESYDIPVTEKVTYNLSWFVKAINAGTTSGGATAQVKWIRADATTISTTAPLAPTIETDGFVRRGARVKAPLGAVSARIILSLTDKANNQQATAWFDNIQFEYIPAINRYNILYNGDFELDYNNNNQPDGWFINDFDNPPGILDATSTNYFSGTRSYKMTGDASYRYISQQRDMEGGDGIPFELSCWTKSSGTINPAGVYSLTLQFWKYDNRQL